MILLLPHRNENDLFAPFDTARDAFTNKQHDMDRSINQTYFSFANNIDSAVRRIRLLEELEEQEHDQQIERADAAPSAFYDSSYEVMETTNYSVDISNTNSINDSYVSHDLSACRMSLVELNKAISFLTPSQHQAFEIVKNHYREYSEPLKLFISGGGGVGKSFIINVIIAYIEHSHAILPGKSPVLVFGPTGTAARNIHGQRVHSLLKIQVNTYNEYIPLYPQVLQRLRNNFLSVHTLIIDEISMISSEILQLLVGD